MYSKDSNAEFFNEFIFSTSRSGGAGGQNVNKVSTKVELKFNISNSQILKEDEKVLINEKLKNKISNEGYLIVVSQEERTQLGNKRKVVDKFFKLINAILLKRKVRKATKPSKMAVRERLKSKRLHSEKKSQRKFDLE